MHRQQQQPKQDSKPQEDVFSQLDITDIEKKSQPIKRVSFSQKVSESQNPFDIYSKDAVKNEKSVEKVIEKTPAVIKPTEGILQPDVEENEEEQQPFDENDLAEITYEEGRDKPCRQDHSDHS